MKAVAARYCMYIINTRHATTMKKAAARSRTQNNFASRAPRPISKEKRSPRARHPLSSGVHIIRSAQRKFCKSPALFSWKISAAPALSFISSGSTIATVSSENLLFPIFACGALGEGKENVASERWENPKLVRFHFFFRCAFLIEAREDFSLFTLFAF